MKSPLRLPLDKAAALFVDLQEEHRRDARFLAEGFDAVIGNCVRLQEAARDHGIPLFHCAYVVDPGSDATHPFHPVRPDGTSVFSDKDDPLSAVCAEVVPRGDEPLLVKSRASGFATGALAPMLRARDVEWLFVAGAWTEACVDATVRDAIEHGFRVLLVKDACVSGTIAMHQIGILNLANRLYGGAVVDTSAACRLMAGESAPAWRIEGAVPFRFTFETAEALYDSL